MKSLRSGASHRLSASCWCWPLVALPLQGCVPDQPLASYRRGGASAPAIESPQSPLRSEGASVDDTGRTASDPARVEEARSNAPDAALPLDADKGDAVDAADGRSVSPATLVCRAGCACERREDRDFMFCGTAVTHAEAVDLCATAGGTLVSVDDAEQNTWISQRMEAAAAADDFWLSGTDLEDEGVWRWQDGRVFFDETTDAASHAAYVPWDENQPNDLGGEDCMRLTAGVWLDLDCESELPFACQG